MNFAIIGCGYVADMYMQTLPGLDGITLLGAYDRAPERLAAFTAFHKIHAYPSMEAVLADERVQMVVNLTNPRSHYEVSLRALESGRHVYSEKPLAMTMEEADALAAAARARGLQLASAPCNHLSDVVQALKHELESGRLGKPLLAQAEMDDGMVSALDYSSWRSISGAPWPARDEFEVGCTMEHAGYQISPLVALFGPVRRVTAFSACLLPGKGAEIGVTDPSPDLSIGVLEFDGGVVARLTNSIIAPSDRSLRVVCEGGVATLSDVWEYHTPLRISPTGNGLKARVPRLLEKRLSRFMPKMLFGWRRRVRYGRQVPRTQGGHHMDFSRGIAQLAAQIEKGAPALVSSELALHVTEVTLALQSPASAGQAQVMRTGQDLPAGMAGA
ncbi:Gfo/Idh/MocA family oxidoreductase [Roseomonas sp. SSH11]|uniref:Gfo/Idh/MocA family oxidoreductase n=1 Tax=Pararoseomonas baculiformis TaxID=2820812 RepID=A0ABS4AJM0_9PROT|nr:Gfo/Idh/MocA family oxidoreductase [Pararoseomonas baculiformis]MBP0447232.1 Gfo/Idh/MocA family oxidoreductase [Pararoseomonas baculiformis]